MKATISSGTVGPDRQELHLRLQFVHSLKARRELRETLELGCLRDPTDSLPPKRRRYVRIITGKTVVCSTRINRCTSASATPDQQGGAYCFTEGKFPFRPSSKVACVSRVMSNPHSALKKLLPGFKLGELPYLCGFAEAKKLGCRWVILVVKKDMRYPQMLLGRMGCECLRTSRPLFSNDIPFQDPVEVVAMIADLQCSSCREALKASWISVMGRLTEVDPEVCDFRDLIKAAKACEQLT